MNKANVDLNLLRAFEVLMKTGSVSKTAQKLGVTQSAMSHILNRLRTQFDDELLVKKGSGMIPTNRAMELYSSIQAPLYELQLALEPKCSFVPETSEHVFNLATTDYFELVLFPSLFNYLSTHAPGVKIKCRNLEDHQLSDVGHTIDLIFGHYKSAPDNLYRKTLWHESFVTIASKTHPRLKTSLNLADYLNERHVLISPSGSGVSIADNNLQQQGKKRNVHLFTSNFLSPIHAVKNSDLIATIPKRTVKDYENVVNLFEPPIDIAGFDLHMLWSKQSHKDPAHQWLRDVISKCAQLM